MSTIKRLEIFNAEFFFLQNFLNYSTTPPRLAGIIQDCMVKYAHHEVNAWTPLTENKPEHGVEVLGYNESWIHPDFNPKGTCICYSQDAGYWLIAKWCDQHDEWHTRYSKEAEAELGPAEEGMPYIDAPTHYREIPGYGIERK